MNNPTAVPDDRNRQEGLLIMILASLGLWLLIWLIIKPWVM
jgi:hypothetical protein